MLATGLSGDQLRGTSDPGGSVIGGGGVGYCKKSLNPLHLYDGDEIH